MNNKNEYYLGVDIGGTKTVFALADQDGNVQKVLYKQGANHELCGLETVEKVLSEGINQLVSDTGIILHDIKSVYYGAAGLDTENDFKILQPVFEKVSPGKIFKFENDGLIALKSGTINGIGVVITCGTGNINFAVNSKGQVRRIGGISFYVGDILGALPIAGKTFMAALRSKDGRGYPTILEALLPKALNVKQLEDITDLERTPRVIQKIIETLFEAANSGDGKALSIIWKLVKETLNIISVLYNDLFKDEKNFKLVLEGSVFKHQYPVLMDMLSQAIMQKYNVEIIVPDWDPVVGALFFAFESDNIKLVNTLTQTITKTYIQKRNAG